VADASGETSKAVWIAEFVSGTAAESIAAAFVCFADLTRGALGFAARAGAAAAEDSLTVACLRGMVKNWNYDYKA
jgi:hypothetical protein